MRHGFIPAGGPPSWTSGTLFPQSSRKLARAVNTASGNRPLVVLANLSGFDGSPESMRRWQLEYGAEIGRAEKDPIVREAATRLRGATDATASALRARFAETTATVRSAKLGEVADEFDRIHTIQRALAVGSVDRIITARELRPYIVDALERGMAATDRTAVRPLQVPSAGG